MGLGSLLGGIGFGYLTNIGNPLPTTTPTTDIGLFPPTPLETTQPIETTQSLSSLSPQETLSQSQSLSPQSLNPTTNIQRFLDSELISDTISEVPQQDLGEDFDIVSTEQAQSQTKKALEEQQQDLTTKTKKKLEEQRKRYQKKRERI
jgi:hypothetical protein